MEVRVNGDLVKEKSFIAMANRMLSGVLAYCTHRDNVLDWTEHPARLFDRVDDPERYREWVLILPTSDRSELGYLVYDHVLLSRIQYRFETDLGLKIVITLSPCSAWWAEFRNIYLQEKGRSNEGAI